MPIITFPPEVFLKPEGELIITVDAPDHCDCRGDAETDVHGHAWFRYPNGAYRMEYLALSTELPRGELNGEGE
jgi:hypothetical protein